MVWALRVRTPSGRCAPRLHLGGAHTIAFDEDRDIVWHIREALTRHQNGMRFSAWNDAGELLLACEYYSIGSGFVETADDRLEESDAAARVTYPLEFAKDLLETGRAEGKAVWDIVLENELCIHAAADIEAYIDRLWHAMQQCVERGLRTEGFCR